MFLLNHINQNKFLNNTSTLIAQYNLNPNSSFLGKLIQFLQISEYFSKEIFELYTEYYQRQFIILELLAGKQGLETDRQVFNLVRHHISPKNIKLKLTDIVNIYLSHIYHRIVITPEVEQPLGLYFVNPE